MITPFQKLHQRDKEIIRNNGRRASSPGWTGEDARPPLFNFYFTSTVAPASVNFFRIVSASSLETPSLIAFGAPSTKSLASFKPRLVTSRTALITLILLAPTSFSMTVNSVFSSAGAAAAAPPPPAITTGAAAAAETPSFSSSLFTSCAASSSDSPTICSSNCCRSAMLFLQFCEWRHSKLCLYQCQLLISPSAAKVSSATRLRYHRARQRSRTKTAQPSATDNQILSDDSRRPETL